jgi:hypothetical protein
VTGSVADFGAVFAANPYRDLGYALGELTFYLLLIAGTVVLVAWLVRRRR